MYLQRIFYCCGFQAWLHPRISWDTFRKIPTWAMVVLKALQVILMFSQKLKSTVLMLKIPF